METSRAKTRDSMPPLLALEQPELIRFSHFIVHLIDQASGNPKKSDLETPLDANFPLELFQKHVFKAISDPNHRLARFKPSGTQLGAVGVAAEELRGGECDFVAASQQVADKFFSVMALSKTTLGAFRPKPGDLVIAQFEISGDTQGRQYLAILKIDPLEAVIRRVETEGGLTRVVFEQATGIIPSAADTDIHKIALLLPSVADSSAAGLVVLDTDLPGKKVARFFYGDFLESELLRGADDTTQLIRHEILGFLPRLDPGEWLEVLSATNQALEGMEPMPLRRLISAALQLPSRSPEEAEGFRAELLARFQESRKPDERIAPDDVIQTSPDTARKLAEKVTISLDNEMKIEVSREGLMQLEKDHKFSLAPRFDRNGRATLTIKSEKFEVVSRVTR